MLPLRELQLHFLAALFDPAATASVEGEVQGGALLPAERLQVYRNNFYEGFAKVLALEFPVIEKLVGADYFRQLARDYQSEHPSRRGNLHGVGENFPGFLDVRFAGTQYAYFPDVARLEWQVQEVLVAEDPAPLEPAALAAIDAASYEFLRFTLHPAAKLASSRFPILGIWLANQDDSGHGMDDHGMDDKEPLSLDSGAEAVLVRRGVTQIEMLRLAPGEHAFIQALANGAPLGSALATASEAAALQYGSFDVGRTLQRLFAARAFAAVEVAGDAAGESA
jgi:hypothetical protein